MSEQTKTIEMKVVTNGNLKFVEFDPAKCDVTVNELVYFVPCESLMPFINSKDYTVTLTVCGEAQELVNSDPVPKTFSKAEDVATALDINPASSIADVGDDPTHTTGEIVVQD